MCVKAVYVVKKKFCMSAIKTQKSRMTKTVGSLSFLALFMVETTKNPLGLLTTSFFGPLLRKGDVVSAFTG